MPVWPAVRTEGARRQYACTTVMNREGSRRQGRYKGEWTEPGTEMSPEAEPGPVHPDAGGVERPYT